MLRLAVCAATLSSAFGLIVPAATEQASRVRVSHILVSSEEMARTAIDTINSGKSFAEVAEMVSECSSRETGGDLGWIAPGK